MVKASRVKLLTKALRSGLFDQAHGHLTTNPGTPEEQHCCLGVACVIAMEHGVELDYIDQGGLRYYLADDCDHGDFDEHEHTEHCYSNDVVMPYKVQQWYGFDDTDPDLDVHLSSPGGKYQAQISAATLNDDKGFTFAEIADALDGNFVHKAEMGDPSGAIEP